MASSEISTVAYPEEDENVSGDVADQEISSVAYPNENDNVSENVAGSGDEELDEQSANPREADVLASEIGFSIEERGTNCGRRKLRDTRGYTYNVRRENDQRTYWWCSIRNKTTHCHASVIQTGDNFRLGSREHCHEPKPESKTKKRKRPKRAAAAEFARKLQSSKSTVFKAGNLKLSVEVAKLPSSTPQSLHRVVTKKPRYKHSGQKRRTPESAQDVKYRILDEGTRCGRRRLVDSLGYEYNVKCTKKGVTYWWCAIRNKKVYCRATILQRGPDTFTAGRLDHCHKPVFKPKMVQKSALNESENLPSSGDISTPMVGEEAEQEFEIPGEHLTFTVFSQSKSKGGVMLADSEGYNYKLKRQKEDTAYWVCVESSRVTRCGATVSQRGDHYRLGKVEHCHKSATYSDPNDCVGAEKCAPINVAEVVAKCLDFEMMEGTSSDDKGRKRENYPPVRERRNPRDILTGYIPPHFLKKDIRIDAEQHLVLAFKEQIDLLSKAQMWYLDTTVRAVPDLFVQLFSISTCIQLAEEVRHVPLVFVLMSRCQRQDYVKIFQTIQGFLPLLPVNTFVACADVPLWEAVSEVFPGRKLQGCSLHWGKSVWQKVKELGLETSYTGEGEFIINSLLALPFLPNEHIWFAFREIRIKIQGLAIFEALLSFVDATWLSNPAWSLSCWSTFMQPLRTRADVENWHFPVTNENEKPSFYRLMFHFLQQGKLVPVQGQPVCDEKLSSIQKRKVGAVQMDIFYLWDMYSAGNFSTLAFLSKIGMFCSHLLK